MNKHFDYGSVDAPRSVNVSSKSSRYARKSTINDAIGLIDNLIHMRIGPVLVILGVYAYIIFVALFTMWCFSRLPMFIAILILFFCIVGAHVIKDKVERYKSYYEIYYDLLSQGYTKEEAKAMIYRGDVGDE